jgi:hypothetical protein
VAAIRPSSRTRRQASYRSGWTAPPLSYADLLQGVLEEESAARGNAGTQKCLRQAGFPCATTIDQFDFRFRPELKRQVVLRYLDATFVEQAPSRALISPPGPSCHRTSTADLTKGDFVVKTVNMRGFTADASLYEARRHYRSQVKRTVGARLQATSYTWIGRIARTRLAARAMEAPLVSLLAVPTTHWDVVAPVQITRDSHSASL